MEPPRCQRRPAGGAPEELPAERLGLWFLSLPAEQDGASLTLPLPQWRGPQAADGSSSQGLGAPCWEGSWGCAGGVDGGGRDLREALEGELNCDLWLKQNSSNT